MTDDTTPTDDALPMALIAPVTTLTPHTPPASGVLMPTPTRPRAVPKRNAKPKQPPPRRRNAAPAPALRPSVPRTKVDPPPSKKQTFVNLVETLIGAGATSFAGAYAVKWGLHPDLVTVGLGAIGGYAAIQSAGERNRHVASGAASAAGSQLVLRWLNPPKPAPAAPAHAPPVQTAQAPAPAGLRKADLGALPPGMLDSAFERARSELAVAGDGYPTGFEHEHHQFHHGPVMR
jgi:hypothetical protein